MKDYELGTVKVLSEGNPALMVRTKGGWLVAQATGDPGVFDEIGIDFVADDGRLLQLAVVGRDEDEVDPDNPYNDPDYRNMHVYAFDGVHELVVAAQYVTVDDNSHWYEKGQ